MEKTTSGLVTHLHNVLLELQANPYPAIANPPEAPRRASVAVILRVQPNYNHWPTTSSYRPRATSPTSPNEDRRFEEGIDEFFEQDWVKHGDPEVLFIKRATRVGDKWTGHVALPGGKRDPEDLDDQATAKREAFEEVGIDLSSPNAIAVGNLPQRVVTTSWGKVPLMVLCPYIYLLTSSSPPVQRLQPTEVASTHWVPLRALLSPTLRTHEYADVSARLAKSELGLKKWFLQTMLSKMMFAAIQLLPSNSIYCASIPGFVPEEAPHNRSLLGIVTGTNAARSMQTPPPLLLWGLTLGVISDFLEHIPPHNALELWTYPTFTAWDVRSIMWIMSYRFQHSKAVEMSSAGSYSQSTPAMDGATEAEVPMQAEVPKQTLPEEKMEFENEGEEEESAEVGIAGLGLVGRNWGRRGRAKMIARGAAVNSMLEGYYPIVRKAVVVALVGRVTVISLITAYLWQRFRPGRRQ